MLESYESVSPTAILTSYPRLFTDIPYEKEIYGWLSKNCSEEVNLNKLLAPEIEARYKLANKLLDKQNVTQILELAAGYTSRGLTYSKNGYKYVEMDLEEVTSMREKVFGKNKRDIILTKSLLDYSHKFHPKRHSLRLAFLPYHMYQ